MRKFVCTASIFVVFVAIIAWMVTARMPAYVWWSGGYIWGGVGSTKTVNSVSLLLWIFVEVLLPIVIFGGSGTILWMLASGLCNKLQSSIKGSEK